MTIRRILWKFIRSLLLLENLQMHQGKTTCCEPGPNSATATSRATGRSLTDYFTSEASTFSASRSQRPPSPWNVPLTRSSGLHSDNTRPKAKLRFPLVGMKIPPPMKIGPTSAPIQPVSVPKSWAPVTPVVTLPGQEVKNKGFSADPDLKPENLKVQ